MILWEYNLNNNVRFNPQNTLLKAYATSFLYLIDIKKFA